jgi:2-oxo-4-hydroxy-4-carboxy-5-ureidoimidazoline decarboxylase
MEPWRVLDAASREDARRILQTCCGASRWIERMADRRPFGSTESLLAAARDEWFALAPADWLEAFAAHPRIGDRAELERRFADAGRLAGDEQRGVANAAPEVLDALAEGNREYELKFGYIFIVCATGKTAGEMLTALRARLANDPQKEVRIAASEQAKITDIRLRRVH